MQNPPKEPRRIDKLHEQILTHSDYKTKLSEGTRFAFDNGCVCHGSQCDKENNQWSRQIWRYLYLGTPMEEENQNNKNEPVYLY